MPVFRSTYLRILHFIVLNISIIIIFTLSSCIDQTSLPGFSGTNGYSERALVNYTDSLALAMKNDAGMALAEIDSIIEISTQQNLNSVLVNALYHSARFKDNTGDFAAGYADLQRAYKIVDQDDKRMVTLLLIEMAENQLQRVNYPIADSLVNIAAALAEELQSHQLLATINNTAASIETGRGNFLKANELYLKAAGYFLEINDSANFAIVHENIGLVYRHSGNNEKAFEYLRKAYLINQSLSDTLRLANNQNSLGVLFSETNQPDSGIAYYQKSLHLYRALGSKRGMAMTYMNIANLLTGKADFESASGYYDSSLAIIREMGSEYGLVLEKINRGSFYIKKGMAKQAIPLLEVALDDCRRLKLISEESEVLRSLYEAWLAEKNYKTALAFFIRHDQIADSLKSTETQEKLARLQNDFEIQRREVRLLKLEKTLLETTAKNRKQRSIFAISLIILMLIALILFYRKRSTDIYAMMISQKLEQALNHIEKKNQELLRHSMQLTELQEQAEKSKKEKEDSDKATEDGDAQITATSEAESGRNLKGMMTGEFESRFENVNAAFFSKLLLLHPALSPAELRICGLLRSNMTSKEIAVLTNRSVRTIENTRNNIRIKLKLSSDTKLNTYLMGVE